MTSAPADLVYSPHPRQLAFHRCDAAWRWLCAGYGVGKTTASVIEALRAATVTHPGYVGIAAAPSYAMLYQAWVAEWRRWVPQGLWRLREGSLSGPRIEVHTSSGPSTIYLRSTDRPASNEGINAAWLCFDEASRENDRAAFDVLASRVRVGYPGRQRTIILTGPPMTRRHWTATEFGTGPGGDFAGDSLLWRHKGRAVVRARTRDNPYLPADYERGLRERPGASRAWCAQLLDAEFGAMEGQVYEAFTRDVHVVDAASLIGRQWRRVVVGVDWGWSHPGVCLVLAMDGAGDIFVLAEEVHQRKVIADTPDGWGPIWKRLAEAWRPQEWTCDPSQPSSTAVLHRVGAAPYGGRATPADNRVEEGIRRVTARLERATARGAGLRRAPGIFVSSACVHTIGEFESYARRKARDGSILEAPAEVGDDAMDALRYGVMALTRHET